MKRVALRRLSSVEIDLGASHQREFHAVALRRQFGLGLGTTSGRLLALFWPTAGDPVCDDTTYTLYDARKAPRTEYHLYPKTRLFTDCANAGDLLVIFRSGQGEDLCILVAERDSDMERCLLARYFGASVPGLDRFTFPESDECLDATTGHAQRLLELTQNLGFDLG